MTFRSAEQRLAMLALGVAAVLAAYNWLVEPSLAYWSRLKHQREAKQAELAKARRLAMSAPHVKSAVARWQRHELTGLGKERAVSVMLDQMDQLARTAGVRLKEVKPQGASSKGAITEYQFELTVEGDLQPLVMFLHQLRTHLGPLTIERSSIASLTRAAFPLEARFLVTILVVGTS